MEKMQAANTQPNTASHSTNGAHASSRAKAGAAGVNTGAPAAGNTDFLSLLLTLGGDDVLSGQALDLGASEDASLLGVGQSAAAPDMGALLAWQGGQSLGSNGINTLTAGAGGELGLVAQTAALDNAKQGAPALQGAGLTAMGTPPNLNALHHLARIQAAMSSAAEGSTLQAANMQRATQTESAALAQSTSSALLSTVPSTLERHAAGLGGALAGGAWQGDKSTEPPASGNLMTGLVESLRSQGDASRGSGQDASGSGQADGSWGQAAQVGSVTDVSAAEAAAQLFDTSGMLPAEDAIAQQVAYWVNDNIQNAQLTVEHGGHPVEVNVSLNGKEAHITFLSDQGQTRDMLDASSAQLRDLLGREGLMLSGMTVGDSASRGSDASRDGNGRRDGARVVVRQAQVAVPAVEGARAHVPAATDRAVDLFV